MKMIYLREGSARSIARQAMNIVEVPAKPHAFARLGKGLTPETSPLRRGKRIIQRQLMA
jgi:hypothetical protein